MRWWKILMRDVLTLIVTAADNMVRKNDHEH